MSRITAILFAGLISVMPLVSGQAALALETSAGEVTISPVATGLNEPWSVAFLPDGGFLVTERGGTLRRYAAPGDKGAKVSGLPNVFARGQGGLFDILVPRDFAQSGEIFLTYARPQSPGAGTAIARARLDGTRLRDAQVIWRMPQSQTGGRHFGGRLVEARDRRLFLTIGERGRDALAQDPRRLNGKIIRINRDGSIPGDNPFAGGANPEIWSLGHRNPQGAALDASGQLWVNEHGAKGGDEINRVDPGRNYGWPVISYGTDYDGSKIGEGTAKPGLEQPAFYWDPSIAPSGLVIYSGKLWPAWKGDFLTGSLKFDMISRLDPDRGWAEERIKSPQTGRVRDIREAPDGSIWFLSVTKGAVYRMTPG